MSAVCVYNKHQQQLEWNGGMLWFSLSLAGPISANLHKTLVKLRRPVGCACFQKRTLLFPSVLRLLLFCISLHHQHQHRHAFERAQGSISPNRLLASRSCLQRGRNQRQTSSLLQFSPLDSWMAVVCYRFRISQQCDSHRRRSFIPTLTGTFWFLSNQLDNFQHFFTAQCPVMRSKQTARESLQKKRYNKKKSCGSASEGDRRLDCWRVLRLPPPSHDCRRRRRAYLNWWCRLASKEIKVTQQTLAVNKRALRLVFST